MQGPSKILIVDDEPFNVDYLEQELEDLGYTTPTVSLDLISLVASSCGYTRGEIEPRVAQ